MAGPSAGPWYSHSEALFFIVKAEEPLKDFKLASDMRKLALKNNYSGGSVEKMH